MMYGTVETDEERIEHMMRLRDLQDETGGFTAFITWSYQPEHTEHGGYEATGVDYLRTLALARIVLDNFDNLQASWVTQGGKVGQLSLAFGANDMGSVMIEENVVRAAGASYCMDEVEIVANIEDAGFIAKRRNMHYEILGDPIFRERDVPRMLALATARADGDTSVPEELQQLSRRAAAQAKQLRTRAVVRLRFRLTYRADWISADCQYACRFSDGWVASTADAIRRRRRRRAAVATAPAIVGLGACAILPALVNAHTHLELSYLRGRVPPATGFVDWVRAADGAAPARHPDPTDAEILDAARTGDRRGAGERHRPGRRRQQHAGDGAAAARSRHAGARVLRAARLQCTPIRPRRSRRPRGADAAAAQRAAPTSASAWRRTRRIRSRRGSSRRFAPTRRASDGDVSTVHLGESPEEVELLRQGRAMARDARATLGVWTEPGGRPASRRSRTSPTSASSIRASLAVHGVQCSRRRPRAPAGARHDRRVVPAQQPLCRRRRPAARGVLRDGCVAWHSAPTAWPASPT